MNSMNRLDNQDKQAFNDWLTQNKPNEEQSSHCNLAFKNLITFSDDPDDNVFNRKTEKIIEDLSKTTTGYALLQKVIALGQQITIKKHSPYSFSGLGIHNHATNDGKTMGFSYIEFKEFTIGGDENTFIKMPKIVTFFHELTHIKNRLEDSEATNTRASTSSEFPNMSNKEEEATIWGRLEEGIYESYCFENAIRKELGYPLRSNHLGAQFSKIQADFKDLNSRSPLSIFQSLLSPSDFEEDPYTQLFKLSFISIMSSEFSSQLMDLFSKSGKKPSEATLNKALTMASPIETIKKIIALGVTPSEKAFKKAHDDALLAGMYTEKEFLDIVDVLLSANARPSSDLEEEISVIRRNLAEALSS